MGYSFIEKKGSEESEKQTKRKISFSAMEPQWSLNEIIFSQKLKDQLSDIISFCKKCRLDNGSACSFSFGFIWRLTRVCVFMR